MQGKVACQEENTAGCSPKTPRNHCSLFQSTLSHGDYPNLRKNHTLRWPFIGSLSRDARQVHSTQYLPVCEGQALLTDGFTKEKETGIRNVEKWKRKSMCPAGMDHLSYRGFLQFDHKFI